MFITKNLRLLNLTSREATLLKDLVDTYNERESSKSEWIHITYHDKPAHIRGADLEVLLKEGLVRLCNSKCEEDTDSFLSDLKINKNRLEEIENHFKVIYFHNNHNNLIFTNNISDLVYEMIKGAWLF